MSRWHSYFNSARKIIENYTGLEPLASFLKDHFSQHKKYGSKDRKYIVHLCYSYYRLGENLDHLDTEEKLKAALFLCNDEAAEWQLLFNEHWLQHWTKNSNERIDFIKSLYVSFSAKNIFPFYDEISKGIDAAVFATSHLIQPDLFVRIRPGKKNIVTGKLKEHQINFKQVSESCLSLANTTRLDNIIELNKEVVIQDYSSQRITDFFEHIKKGVAQNTPIKTWDCCAASGGKSILAYDVLRNIELTVSDLRPSIINNLKKRFHEAGIKKYQSLVIDLTKPLSNFPDSYFQLIICDAPCSGSGTWGRTPEQLHFFSKEKIHDYASLQKKIVASVIPHLGERGYFLYITCSVFKKENEAVVDFIKSNFGLNIIKQELLTGFDKKADTMFAALFRKN